MSPRSTTYRRCTRCKQGRPDVWLRSKWSAKLKRFEQRLLCGTCGRAIGFHFNRPKWARSAA